MNYLYEVQVMLAWKRGFHPLRLVYQDIPPWHIFPIILKGYGQIEWHGSGRDHENFLGGGALCFFGWIACARSTQEQSDVYIYTSSRFKSRFRIRFFLHFLPLEWVLVLWLAQLGAIMVTGDDGRRDGLVQRDGTWDRTSPRVWPPARLPLAVPTNLSTSLKDADCIWGKLMVRVICLLLFSPQSVC